MQGKAEEEEKVRKDFRGNESHIKLMNTRRKTCQKFNVTDVINMDTMPEIVLYERKEGGMQPLLNVDGDPPHTRSDPAEEFFFISSLSGTIPTSNNVWLIDSGASRHMTGYKENLTELVEKDSRLHVVLGDDA
jgi:hypothetical protein